MLIFVLPFLNQNVLILILLGDLKEEENRIKNSNWMIRSKTVLGIWIQSSIVQSDGQKKLKQKYCDLSNDQNSFGSTPSRPPTKPEIGSTKPEVATNKPEVEIEQAAI